MRDTASVPASWPEWLGAITAWIDGTARNHGVDPVIFLSIYIGATPILLMAIAWLVRRLRSNGSIVMPVVIITLSFLSSYIYLALFGRDIPLWVWGVLAVLLLWGSWQTWRDVRRKAAARTQTSAPNYPHPVRAESASDR